MLIATKNVSLINFNSIFIDSRNQDIKKKINKLWSKLNLYRMLQ